MKKKVILICLFYLSKLHAETVILCDVSNGLTLVQKKHASPLQIELILKSCDKVKPEDPNVLLLHGLFARRMLKPLESIKWLKKARRIAPENRTILLELAVSYEQSSQLKKAARIYEFLLEKNMQDRAALLGKAKIDRFLGNLTQAESIYLQLLKENSNDVDALNGLGWIESSKNQLEKAYALFSRVLTIRPQNQEALTALHEIKSTQQQMKGPPVLCAANKGLALLNQTHPPISDIKHILEECRENHIENQQSMMLRGLLARYNNHHSTSIFWFEKAIDLFKQDTESLKKELAVSYELAGQMKEALLIYEAILQDFPDDRGALLGKARTLRSLQKYDAAQLLYNRLIAHTAKDVDALNGLGWIALAQNKLTTAYKFFQQALSVQPDNKEAQKGLLDVKLAKVKPPAKTKVLCEADKGLILVNKSSPPFNTIYKILARCDKYTPNSVNTLLLHGLLARAKQDYPASIIWLKRAVHHAEPGNFTPALELALTYERASRFQQASRVYQMILANEPQNTSALLGQARVLRFSYQIPQALKIYRHLLSRFPNSIEVLNGLAETHLANYDFIKARTYFNKVLLISPSNQQAKKGLMILADSTKNILDLTVTNYRVPPLSSEGFNLDYFKNLNATDGLIIQAAHNTRQIESGFGEGPTLLPNNRLLIGYNHIIPNKYAWELSYDARQHDSLPFEHRIYGSANLFLYQDIEWFGGARFYFPSPWNTQLVTSGLTFYTSMPFNVTVIGFWANQEIGGYNSSYVLDFSKEYDNHLFYLLGTSYLPEQSSWDVHGRLVLPILKNQALLLQGSHYWFNSSTFITAGWRVYWA